MEFLRYFEHICAIPHCSFKSEKLGDFLFDFAQKKGFETKMDAAGNIHAIKGKPKICLQAHYDMVCVGNAPQIKIINDGKMLRAENSSLGADNGIGIAIMMQMMDEKKDLEVLFTNNEEVGLIGANAFNDKIKAPNLLNLDSERDDEVIIGCAGGLEISLEKKLALQKCENGMIYALFVGGLPGGHSGIQIAKNIPNAIIELVNFIKQNELKILFLKGGNKNNAIPADASAIVLSKKELKSAQFVAVQELAKVQNGEFKAKNLKNSRQNESLDLAEVLKELSKNEEIFAYKNSDKVLDFILSLPHGVLAYDEDLAMAKTSINLAIITQKTHKNSANLQITFYARSNEEKELNRLGTKMAAHANIAGFSCCFGEHSLPWQPQNSDFANLVLEALQKRHPNAKIKAIHAGLECGVLQAKNPTLKACSIGPNIFSPHSTSESCEIKSTKIILEVVRELLG